ncbi:MAG: DNA-processing protein DprA [Marinobacter sp.]|nr:DNA-processing protein DprA [Marinobacter sp.]
MPQLCLDPALTNPFFQDPAAAWLLLSRLPGLRTSRWQRLVDELDTPLQLLDMPIASLKGFALKTAAIDLVQAWQRQDQNFAPLAAILLSYQQAQADGQTLLGWGDERYPPLLRHIHDAPRLLYVKGRLALLQSPQIALVGSRNATRMALEDASRFAAALVTQGYTVTSGLALGVDGAAHRGALTAQGATIAVTGTGLDVSYPRPHAGLAAEIGEQGVLVSEFPPGTAARASHFPQRNRIISGLSVGVLVVEASLKSGSLITARLALEQGREVFAMPGSIHNPQARGCHALIRQGATLVETVDDILEQLQGWSPLPAPPPASASPCPDHLDEPARRVLEVLDYNPASTDTLCALTGLRADQLMQALLGLEMEGLVYSVPGGYLRA